MASEDWELAVRRGRTLAPPEERKRLPGARNMLVV